MSELFSSPYFSQLVVGDYQAIVQKAVHQASSAAVPDDVPWIIGALSFLGRTREAQGLFAAFENQLKPDLLFAVRFFISVALTREGHTKAARVHLTETLRELRKDTNALRRFFAYQALAFHRYSTGRLGLARRAADTAQEAASAAFFTYGSALTSELLGHIHLSAGLFHAGFRHMQWAREKALVLGKGAILQAIERSIILYKASYGIAKNSGDLQQLLTESLASETFEDSYTQAALNLELARTLILRGDLLHAKEQLESCSELVYRIDNSELEMEYNLLLCLLLRGRGEFHQALSIVRAIKHRVSKDQNVRSHLKVLGMEAQLLKALGLLPEYEAMGPELERLTRLSGSFMGWRHHHRARHTPFEGTRSGEDQLGDLFDRIAFFRNGALSEIFRGAWYGLLPRALNIAPEGKVLYFDAEPGSLTIFNQGDVVHSRDSCTALVRRLIIVLSRGRQSKERLTHQLWQQAYNPLRHDGLIYALVAKARKCLGASGDWIEAYELGYRLRADVKVMVMHPLADDRESVAEAADDGSQIMHPRHLQILNLMRQVEAIEPAEIGRKLEVSDATVSRDMAILMETGQVRRAGRGRATRYSLINAQKLGG